MKGRHPLVNTWSTEHSEALRLSKRGTGPYTLSLSKLDWRRFRLLSSVFFAVEKHSVLPGSVGYPEFHFVHRGILIGASLEPIGPRTHGGAAALRFAIVDLSSSKTPASAEWLDGDTPLEDRISDIADGIFVAARAASIDRLEREKSSLTEELFRLLDRMKKLEEPEAANLAHRFDPRTFGILISLAEQHQTAAIVRRFLRSLGKTIADGSTIIADHSLDDWMAWAVQKTDEFDPLVRGPEFVFKELVKT
jgi:hypothetical protein